MEIRNPVSRLESLPGELFNRILSYVFDPANFTVPESASQFRGYCFDMALLRVNKAIHRLSRDYLHCSLSWVRFTINWNTFLIDPHWLGVPYISIDRVNSQKLLPNLRRGCSERRSVVQDFPAGIISVKVVFPWAITEGQKNIHKRCFNFSPMPSMSLLVMAVDFEKFMTVLRMNDLAFCHRTGAICPIWKLNNLGLFFSIRLTFYHEGAKLKPFVNGFRIFSGPFHQCTLRIASVVKNMPLLLGPPNSHPQTFWEGVSHLFYLKWRGDEYLRKKAYSSAYMCYDAALTLEHNWLVHDRRSAQENFWKPTESIYTAFGVSLAFNLAIAEVAGGLRMGTKRFRGLRMTQCMGVFLNMTGIMPNAKFVEISFITALFEILTETAGPEVVLGTLEIMTTNWKTVHQDRCIHQSTPMGKIYHCAASNLTATDRSATESVDITPHVESLRLVAQDAHFQPITWAIQESRIPEQLSTNTNAFLPKAVVGPVRAGGSPRRGSDEMVFIPEFNIISEDALENGEKGYRVLI